MRSLLNEGELEAFLEDIDYPVPGVVVHEAYSLSEPDAFPCVLYEELVNQPYGGPMTTDEGGIEEGPTLVAYSITVLARDCKVGKRAVTRSEACRMVAEAVTDAMFATYGMQRDDISGCEPVDGTCNALTVRFAGVIDTHDYTYSVR